MLEQLGGAKGNAPLGHRAGVGDPAAGRRGSRSTCWRCAICPTSDGPGCLPDDAFAHDGQLTKQAMRAVTLAALAPRPGELLWDVGAGSGSIAIEWCRSGLGCQAVAFERDEDRRARIGQNAVAFGVRVSRDLRRARDVRLRTAPCRDLRRRRRQSAGTAGRLLGPVATRRATRRQRGDRRVRSGACAMVFASRRRTAQVPALPRRARRRVHRMAARHAGHAVVGDQGDDRLLHRRGTGRGGSDHRARAAPAEPVPGVPLRRVRSCPTICWRCARRAPR